MNTKNTKEFKKENKLGGQRAGQRRMRLCWKKNKASSRSRRGRSRREVFTKGKTRGAVFTKGKTRGAVFTKGKTRGAMFTKGKIT
ncbi:hypothetical protein Avbf_15115, partial [Armadillidium vulgare]